ncbi:MAG: ATP-binding protein, partial [Acidobacteriota bacterium]
MTQGLIELNSVDLVAELENIALPFLIEKLRARSAGHCMRVSDLDLELMVRLCGRLSAEVPTATVVVLSDGRIPVPQQFAVSSTKLVELRNPLPDGSLRPPLLVFVPNDVRASAEDSFGVATFEEVSINGLYDKLRNRLLEQLPNGLRTAITESLRRIEQDDQPWPFADSLSIARFLLTGKINGNDPEALGAALYEIGLVPDFEWLSHPENAPQRLIRNRKCVKDLTWSVRSERGRVNDLRLSNRAFRKQLGDFLADAGADDPKALTRRIVLDRSCWPLSFNKWEFEDRMVQPETICISEVETNLQPLTEDKADKQWEQLIGQRILPLGDNGLRKFSVTFRVKPVPSQVQGLAKFVARIISKDGGPVGLARSKTAWKTGTDRATITFSSLGKPENWEEGWHFVRIVAQTENGDLIPLIDETGQSIPWNVDSEIVGRRANESDLFYVIPKSDIDAVPAQRAVPREASVVHALLSAKFSAILAGRDPEKISIKNISWAERQSRSRMTGSDMLEVRLGSEGIVHVPVSRALKVLEQKILANPDGPISWRISISLGVPEESTPVLHDWPVGDTAEQFLASRRRYFEAIRGGTQELITQGVNPFELLDIVRDYASTYLSLINELARRAEVASKSDSRQAFSELRRILAIDSVHLAINDHRGHRRDATLVAPTHPLRALWFVTWAYLGRQWIDAIKSSPKEYAEPTRDALLNMLTPTNFPSVLPTEMGQVLTAIDSINPFWSLFAPFTEKDPRGLVGEVCAALGLPEPAIGGALIDGRYLASRVRRYLVQHPYVRTLTINVFNPGRATIIADMLLDLQKDNVFSDLRYDIRLFVPDPDAPGVGETLIALLSPDSTVAAREADAFSTPNASHLQPKLRIAIRSKEDFRNSPEVHNAHLSLLFDMFPAEEISARRADPCHSTAFVHGLVQDFSVEYEEDELTVKWRRQPRHGNAQPLPGAEELSDLISTLAATLSSTTTIVATGQTGIDLRPEINLFLNPEDRALLHQVHEVSDWVFTLDRNLGIEFFDHGGRKNRPDYLIDHSPGLTNTLSHRLVITSRSSAEIEALLRPVLEQYRLDDLTKHTGILLNQLRSLSGRLALKLISAPTQQAEAMGLALARLYLEHQGVFENQMVVPLDAHLDLYRILKNHADELGDEVSFKRTDLAFFDLDVTKRLITCRLVEVKCYTSIGNLGTYNVLKEEITEQIAQSEKVLSFHFDPHRTTKDRPDRAFKTRELAMLLEFYLERAERYEIISAQAAEEARYFLRTLDNGYKLTFTRSALIFDFEKPGTEPAEIESGIEYHRIGVDLIRQLIEATSPSTDSSSSDGSGGSDDPMHRKGVAEVRKRRERAPSVLALKTAEFLSKPREYSITWDNLSAQQSSHSELNDSNESIETQTNNLTQREPATSEVFEHIQEGNSTVSVETSVNESSISKIPYDVMLGVTGDSPQYGLLGEVSGRRIAIDLNQTHTISLFGVQGGGKSYTLGTIAEMATLPIPNVNVLPHPLATAIFHYSPTMDYRPEFTSMISPNSEASQIKQLAETYGAEPKALKDVLLLVPADKLNERRAEYPSIEVCPLKFSASELQASHWYFLMGAVGNQATYIRKLRHIMKSLRNNLTLDGLRDGIETSSLPDHLKDMAKMRLDLAAEYIDDTVKLSALIRPGRLIIVDLRDEFIQKDEALGLFVVLLQLFADAKFEEKSFNKLVVFEVCQSQPVKLTWRPLRYAGFIMKYLRGRVKREDKINIHILPC